MNDVINPSVYSNETSRKRKEKIDVVAYVNDQKQTFWITGRRTSEFNRLREDIMRKKGFEKRVIATNVPSVKHRDRWLATLKGAFLVAGYTWVTGQFIQLDS